jgi:hypothetical protein
MNSLTRTRDDIPLPPFPEPEYGPASGRKPYRTIHDAISRIPRDASCHLNMVKRLEPHKERTPYDPRTLAKCITTNGGQTNYHPSGLRNFSPRERARLQTWRNSYLFVGGSSDVNRQIGNAVPPLVWKAFMAPVVKTLMDWAHGRIDAEGKPIAGAGPSPALPRPVPTLPPVVPEQRRQHHRQHPPQFPAPPTTGGAQQSARPSPTHPPQLSQARAAWLAARQQSGKFRTNLARQQEAPAPGTPGAQQPFQAGTRTLFGQCQPATQPPTVHRRPNPGRQPSPAPRTSGQQALRAARTLATRQRSATATVHQRYRRAAAAAARRAATPPLLRTARGHASLPRLLAEALSSAPAGAPPTGSGWSPRAAGDDDGDVVMVSPPHRGEDDDVIEVRGADEMVVDVVAEVAPRTVIVLDS